MIELFAPRAGQRLSQLGSLTLAPSGSATIIAGVAARLGSSVTIIGAVGSDELGDEWKRRVAESGVDVRQVARVPDQLTPIAISTVDLAGEKTYAFYRFPGFSDPLDELQLSKEQENAAVDADVFVLTEAAIRGAGLRRTIEPLLSRRQERGGLTVFSANYRAEAWHGTKDAALALTTFANRAGVVCCNRLEYELLSAAGLSTEVVYETLGADGINVHVGSEAQWIPAASVPGGVVLDTGAGDCFCAAVAVRLAEGCPPIDAARFAAAASSLLISREGMADAAPTRDEIEAHLHAQGNPRRKSV